MSKRAALHKSHNNTGLARRLVPLDNHSTTGRQIRRQMFQHLSKKPFPTHKCRGSQRRDFEEEWLQRPILVVKSCKGDEKNYWGPFSLIQDYSFELQKIRQKRSTIKSNPDLLFFARASHRDSIYLFCFSSFAICQLFIKTLQFFFIFSFVQFSILCYFQFCPIFNFQFFSTF